MTAQRQGFTARLSAAAAEVGKVAASGLASSKAIDDRFNARGANIAADVFVRLLGARLAGGDQDETASAAVSDVLIEHGLGGGAGAREEIDHDAIGVGRLGHELLHERGRLGVGEHLSAENLFDHAGALAGLSRPQNADFMLVFVLVEARDPTADGVGVTAQVFPMFFETGATKADRLADPKSEVGRVACEQGILFLRRRRNIPGINRRQKFLQRFPCLDAFFLGVLEDDFVLTYPLLHRLCFEFLDVFRFQLTGVTPDEIVITRIPAPRLWV